MSLPVLPPKHRPLIHIDPAPSPPTLSIPGAECLARRIYFRHRPSSPRFLTTPPHPTAVRPAPRPPPPTRSTSGAGPIGQHLQPPFSSRFYSCAQAQIVHHPEEEEAAGGRSAPKSNCVVQ
eukprot:scaffold20395_cov128-Isochrysis_galbana.AAC.1